VVVCGIVVVDCYGVVFEEVFGELLSLLLRCSKVPKVVQIKTLSRKREEHIFSTTLDT